MALVGLSFSAAGPALGSVTTTQETDGGRSTCPSFPMFFKDERMLPWEPGCHCWPCGEGASVSHQLVLFGFTFHQSSTGERSKPSPSRGLKHAREAVPQVRWLWGVEIGEKPMRGSLPESNESTSLY